MLTTDQKGAIAETAIAAAATKLGIGVLRPLSPARYDLAFDLAGKLLRVQCKWAVRRQDGVTVWCRRARRGPEGFIHLSYSRAEVDLIAAYCADLNCTYVLPPDVFDERHAIQLRLTPTRNNQKSGIRWARDFEIERLGFLARGAVAQLGERRAGSAKATGSSPVGSTSLRHI